MLQKLLDLIKGQPVYAMGLVQAGIGAAVAFGIALNALQVGALEILAAAILTFAVQKVVTPVANPTLPAGSVVNVQGTEATQTIQGA